MQIFSAILANSAFMATAGFSGELDFYFHARVAFLTTDRLFQRPQSDLEGLLWLLLLRRL
jgi:hypothetical protein